jgi:glycosyltransferase involved in cell wall biosynthesis
VSEPLVTVVVPAYNRRRWLGECLEAVRAQTYDNIETVVVDDCSTDGTAEWLRAEPKFSFARLHVQPRNMGAAEARNAGVRLARGQLVNFADSDDVMEPRHVETAVEVFRRHPEVGLFACDCRIIGPDGELLHGGRTWHEINGEARGYAVRTGPRSLADVFIFSNIGLHTIRREVFDRVGYQDQSLFPLEDYDMALRVAGAGYGIYYWHEPLSRYRMHDANSSGETNVRVCRQKLRCLRLALERNPELRRLGAAARRRVSEVQIELAISYLRAGERAAALRELAQALAGDPGQITRVARLGARRLRRLATA